MQTEVLSRFVEAVEGMLSDNSMIKDCLSRVSEEASAEIPFGRMLKAGSTDPQVLLPTATSDLFAGVSVFNHAYAKPNELGDTGLKPMVAFNILNKGRLWVRTEDAVTQASEVHVRCVTGGSNGYGAAGAESAGAFRGTADSTDCVDVSAFCRWMKSAGAGELAELEVDMTSVALSDAD